jgi:hypothetical protein
MSKWKIACSAAIFAAAVAAPAHADDFTKLSLLTFSGPVDVPGITLPAGTYRFELADPTTGRRVVKVADKDGKKTYGMFISVPNQRLTPSDKPVVMFNETVVGAPPAVQAWFYPGETFGYEFAYPHGQALKIAKATHQPVLSYADRSNGSASDSERMASMKSAQVSRIDENDKPVSSDEALKESTAARAPVATPSTQTARVQPRAATPGQDDATIGTSGTRAAAPARKHLPRTGSVLPLLVLISSLSLAGAFGVRLARRAL